MSTEFSFIILTYNEEIHLPRLLNSIAELKAPVFVLDSGSTDNTLNIADTHNAPTLYRQFDNHPLQWKYALDNFNIETPWTIGLDADQFFSNELYVLLKNFRNRDIESDIDGIYFNRKNYFKGKWIRHGGYFPKFMLKMFRTGKGESSLAEKLDHRFVVKGRTIVWKNGYLIEENLKENNIGFWIDKHNKYSDLVAKDEFERAFSDHKDSNVTSSSPDTQVARKKNTWRKMPLLIRPVLYFFYRYFIQLGFLDGKTGFVFHFLQAFWFRLVVDVKIIELQKADKSNK